MKARTAARELALFALFQALRSSPADLRSKPALQELILNTVRSLSDLARDQIETVSIEISKFYESLLDIEADDPTNYKLPLDEPNLPVPVPTTQEMRDRLLTLLQSVEALQEALYVPEINALSQREDVQNYCLMLVRLATENQAKIVEKINEVTAEGWRADRFQKLDLSLLTLAVTEMCYVDSADNALVVDEWLELAKQFTSDESRKFIHGILGGVSQQQDAEKEALKSV